MCLDGGATISLTSLTSKTVRAGNSEGSYSITVDALKLLEDQTSSFCKP